MNDLVPPAQHRKLDADWLRRRMQKQTVPVRGFEMESDPAARNEPFPLTDMQQAYWLGRDGALAGGGTMQMLHEFDGERLDADRLEHAWNALIARHDMLRAVVTPSGQQRVLAHVPHQSVERVDVSASADAKAELLALRARMVAEAPPLDTWPQSRLVYVTRDAARGRLIMRLDMWCFDG